jgi:hypothetical protein
MWEQILCNLPSVPAARVFAGPIIFQRFDSIIGLKKHFFAGEKGLLSYETIFGR